MKRYITLLLFYFLVFFVVANMLSYNDGANSVSQEQVSATILHLGINAADLETLDPHFAASFNDRLVVDMVYNALIRFKPGNAPMMEPDLAESIPEPVMVNGKQVWTFKLKKGVMFHRSPKTESYELTADDVVYSFRKSADPKRSAYAGEYTGMTVEKVDDYTSRIIVDQPMSPIIFLSKITDYAGGFIISKKAVEAMGDEAIKTHPVGTGPFRFDSYTCKKKFRLVANERYFRGYPLLKGVEIHYLPDPEKRDAGFRQGWLDVIRGVVETEWIEEVLKNKDVLVDLIGVSEVANIHFNTSVKPLQDIRVRKAIAYALNRDKFLAPFGKDIAANAHSPVPGQFLPGGLTEKEVKFLDLDYSTDLEKARRLLAEAGYPHGFSLEVVVSEFRALRKNCESMKKQLAQIGIDLKLHIVGHSTMHRLIRQDMSPIVIYEAWRPNVDVFLTRFFHSESIVVTGDKPDTNFSHYVEIDNLIEAARKETDPAKQVKLWKYAQIKLLEDMVVYPIHYKKKVYARKNYVDYGHPLVATVALYPQFTEKTRIVK